MGKRFVQISNNTNQFIRVVPEMKLINATNIKTPARDRLNVKPAWQKFGIVIEPQLGYYPAEVANWNTVKSLVKAKKFTIGAYCDEADISEEAWIKKAQDMEKKLKNANAQFEKDVANAKKVLEADNRPANAENPV